MDKHGDFTISARPFSWRVCKEVSDEQLKQAAKRYPADARFQKFARAFVAMKELEQQEDPLPCVPVRCVAGPARSAWLELSMFDAKAYGRKMLGTWAGSTACRVLLLVFVVRCLCKPSITGFLAKPISL